MKPEPKNALCTSRQKILKIYPAPWSMNLDGGILSRHGELFFRPDFRGSAFLTLETITTGQERLCFLCAGRGIHRPATCLSLCRHEVRYLCSVSAHKEEGPAETDSLQLGERALLPWSVLPLDLSDLRLSQHILGKDGLRIGEFYGTHHQAELFVEFINRRGL